MRCICYFAVLLLFVLNCSSEPDIQKLDSEPPLTDILTLELSFGDEKTIVKDEFLLAIPNSIEVDMKGDIYVLDEDHIKVFNNNGEPKAIFGGPGQGPGELQRAGSMTLGETGYITVSSSSEYNVFSPDYKFLRRYYFKQYPPFESLLNEMNLRYRHTEYVGAIDKQEQLYVIEAFDIDSPLREDLYVVIAYSTSDTVISIANYPQFNTVSRGGLTSIHMDLGEFNYSVFSGKRLVYIYNSYDVDIDENGARYTLHIMNFDSGKKSEITHSYTPKPFPKDPIKLIKESIKNTKLSDDLKKIYEEVSNILIKRYKNIKYKLPVHSLKTDRNYIFVFVDSDECFVVTEKEVTNYLTDVFNADTGQYIRSVIFPFAPLVIRNGYAYRFNKNEEGFYIVEKYKINPAVYVK